MNKRLEATMKKINYLETEIDWQQELLLEQHQEFDEYWRRWCAERDIDVPQFHKPEPKPQSSEKPVELEEKPISEATRLGRQHFKTTYKKLAMAVHPDKNNGDAEDFKELNRSWQEGKWSIIINLCLKYDIPVHNAKEVNRLLQKEATELELVMSKNETMFSWKFWECGEDQECKDQLIQHFLNTINTMKGEI
jgi:hypothetical protein